jgi:hypothetical protein
MRGISLVLVLVTAIILPAGCYLTAEQRWEAFDTQMRQDIGVKTKDYYVSEWGKPTKRRQTVDGEETLIWGWRGYGGAQGWNKSLTFASDGVLKDFQRDYWPKE